MAEAIPFSSSSYSGTIGKFFDSIVPNAIGKIIGRTKPATPPKLTLKAAKIIRKTP